MDEVFWIKLINEGIPFLLLMGLSFTLYHGLKKNQALLSEREELLKRYLLFRGDKHVRLKMYGEDEKIYRELLKNISNSWKNFKKTHDQCLVSLAQNTRRTKNFLYLITLGLIVNSARLLVEEYFFFGFNPRFLYTAAGQLQSYVLVVLGFFLLRTQTDRFLSLKGELAKMDREILFFPNHLSAQEEHEVLYDEFDPLETEEDQNPR
jgi:hypothetical protein